MAEKQFEKQRPWGIGQPDLALLHPMQNLVLLVGGQGREIAVAVGAAAMGIALADRSAIHLRRHHAADRKRVVSGKSVSVREDLGGSPIIKQKNQHTTE